MAPEYDIFEKLSDGNVRWLCCVVGLANAKSKLLELSKDASNELFALDVVENRVVARADPAGDVTTAQ